LNDKRPTTLISDGARNSNDVFKSEFFTISNPRTKHIRCPLDYQLFHNYIRPHMALKGMTPAERCGIKIEGENKWFTIIQNASEGN
jgi:hypothetical protein